MSMQEVHQNMNGSEPVSLAGARMEATSIGVDLMPGNVRIAVVIPEELKERLDHLCEKEHRSLSGQVHMWIVQKVEEWEAANLPVEQQGKTK